MWQRRKKRKGYVSLKPLRSFTLVELLIIIVLLSFLMFSLFKGITVQLQKGRDVARKSNVEAIRKSLEEYYDDAGCYPTCPLGCNARLSFGGSTYLASTPCDPSSQAPYRYAAEKNACPQRFQLYAKLENTNDQLIDIVGCRGGCGPSCEYNYGVSSPNTTLSSCEVLYVCAPGGGQTGSCEVYDSPQMSECPKVYSNDPTCNSECGIHQNRCKNASGKSVPSWKIDTSC